MASTTVRNFVSLLNEDCWDIARIKGTDDWSVRYRLGLPGLSFGVVGSTSTESGILFFAALPFKKVCRVEKPVPIPEIVLEWGEGPSLVIIMQVEVATISAAATFSTILDVLIERYHGELRTKKTSSRTTAKAAKGAVDTSSTAKDSARRPEARTSRK